jgi:hypothetical protein
MSISEIESGQKDLWDVEYLSTSDEEDNDSDEEGTLEESKQKAIEAKLEEPNTTEKPKVKIDVIRMLIEHDSDLLKRDLESKLFKFLLWKKQKKKYEAEIEENEEQENFSWWSHDDDKTYYAMGAKYKTGYRQGDQLFNCYGKFDTVLISFEIGLRTNRFLLLNYGFCLRNNKYNSLGFKVFVNY